MHTTTRLSIQRNQIATTRIDTQEAAVLYSTVKAEPEAAAVRRVSMARYAPRNG